METNKHLHPFLRKTWLQLELPEADWNLLIVGPLDNYIICQFDSAPHRCTHCLTLPSFPLRRNAHCNYCFQLLENCFSVCFPVPRSLSAADGCKSQESFLFLIAQHNNSWLEQYLCRKELLCINEVATGCCAAEAWASAVSGALCATSGLTNWLIGVTHEHFLGSSPTSFQFAFPNNNTTTKKKERRTLQKENLINRG